MSDLSKFFFSKKALSLLLFHFVFIIKSSCPVKNSVLSKGILSRTQFSMKQTLSWFPGNTRRAFLPVLGIYESAKIGALHWSLLFYLPGEIHSTYWENNIEKATQHCESHFSPLTLASNAVWTNEQTVSKIKKKSGVGARVDGQGTVNHLRPWGWAWESWEESNGVLGLLWILPTSSSPNAHWQVRIC